MDGTTTDGSHDRFFLQDSPRLGNQYTEDSALVEALQQLFPPDVYRVIEADLKRFGWRVVAEMWPRCKEDEQNPPQLIQHNGWGKRIDHIRTSPNWDYFKGVSAEEGLISIAYERKQAEWSRLYQFVKLFLFAPSSAIFSCPLAMTDGAARLVELYGDSELKETAFRRLTSRDPKIFATSGQWMTERAGGSDVGRTETIAKKIGNTADDSEVRSKFEGIQTGSLYSLHGYKYFTSATTSEMSFALARITNADGQSIAGSRGLSMFYVPMAERNRQNVLNRMLIHRLKDKMGTKALPTAELELQGTVAKLVGEPQKGVATIACLFNITRFHNSINAVSFMRRAIAIARDYAHRRHAFGKKLTQHPLHVETLSEVEVRYRGCLHFVLEIGVLLGKTEIIANSVEESHLLRFLTPIVKLYTGKETVAVISECIELIGGVAYMEDSGIPHLFRNAQVLPIWEGTTNILSLDVWRVLQSKSGPACWKAFLNSVNNILSAATKENSDVCSAVKLVQSALQQLHKYMKTVLANRSSKDGAAFIEAGAREFAFTVARVYAAALLIRHATRTQRTNDAFVALRWCEKYLRESHLLVYRTAEERAKSAAIGLDQDELHGGECRGTGDMDKTSRLPRPRL